MLKVFTTNAVISKGYDGTAALRYSETGDSVKFRIGKKVYDTRCENNTRWFNITVKAFGTLCERIKKMQLSEGSYINFAGRLDEDSWTDKNTNELRSVNIIILEDIEFASSGSKAAQDKTQNPASQKPQNSNKPATTPKPEESDNFTGFEPFGNESFFD